MMMKSFVAKLSGDYDGPAFEMSDSEFRDCVGQKEYDRKISFIREMNQSIDDDIKHVLSQGVQDVSYLESMKQDENPKTWMLHMGTLFDSFGPEYQKTKLKIKIFIDTIEDEENTNA